MKIAITGGSGFIGTPLIQKLISQGNEVIVLDRGSQKQAPSGARLFDCDILDKEKLIRLTKGCECIVHLAALRSMRESMSKPWQYNLVNIDGTVNVLEAARENKIQKVVFSSSSSVYGNMAKTPQKESENCVPSNPYGLSKLAAEKYCSLYSQNFGVETVSLRIFNVYGPGQPAQAGVIAALCSSAAKRLEIPLYGSGTQRRDFIFIDDVVEAFLLAIKNSSKSAGLSINIGSAKSVSVNEVLKKVIKLSKSSVNLRKMPPITGDVKVTLADISLARKKLGWKPKTGLERGLKKTFESYT